MKVDVEYLKFLWPLKAYLITCGDIVSKVNIIAVSLCMPAAGQPPQLVCAIGKAFYSFELIKQTGEFVINVPTKSLKKRSYCKLTGGMSILFRDQTSTTSKAR